MDGRLVEVEDLFDDGEAQSHTFLVLNFMRGEFLVPFEDIRLVIDRDAYPRIRDRDLHPSGKVS